MIGARRRLRKAFTILEILIAIVVMVLGITGILALFPTAIGSSRQTVEDSYAASIAQSVIDAVKAGLRSTRYAVPGTANPHSYFIFNHDGVLEAAPADPTDFDDTTEKMWSRDYCIILPRAPGATNATAANEPIFLYPVPNNSTATTGTFLGGSSEQRAKARLTANPVDNFDPAYNRTTAEDTDVVWVGRTYQLGRYRAGTTIPTPYGAGDIRVEFRDDDLIDPTSTDNELVSLDPYTRYSFAMGMQRARLAVAGGNPTGNFSDNLFRLRIMVFRSFDVAASDAHQPQTGSGASGDASAYPSTNVPIAEFVTMVAP